jgi:DEAD/DEAH box helicase
MAKKRKLPDLGRTATDDDSEFVWKKIDVGLLGPSRAASTSHSRTGDDDDFEGGNNHYDKPASRIYRSAERDLQADPAEGVGMFLGLEVLDGSQYSVVEEGGHKRLVPKRKGDNREKPLDKKVSESAVESHEEPLNNSPEAASDKITDKSKSKKKRKKKKKAKESPSENSKDSARADVELKQESTNDTVLEESKVDEDTGKDVEEQLTTYDDKEDMEEDRQIESLQNSWMTATGGVALQKTLCKSLLSQNFWNPTPIQAASLPAAILGRRNIVGAAPTGSGKTLAYLLPIFEHLLQQEEPAYEDRKIQALILAPTRELAMQVQGECDKLDRGKCAILVGGLATQKQERVLRTKKPQIIIATPGRLWEMVRAGCSCPPCPDHPLRST